MTDDAIRVLRKMMSRSDYTYLAGSQQLMTTIIRVRLMDEYVEHVRTLPTATERINGTVPILHAWIRDAGSRARGEPL